MIILDSLIFGGLKFVLGRIAAAVDAEMSDDTALREALLAAQMRLELGEITEGEYARIEREILRRINEIRDRRTGGAASPGAVKVVGVEATFAGDERDEPDEPPRARRR